MVTKRRLSHGSTASSLLGDIVEDEFEIGEGEGEGAVGGGLAGGNRRRSMMGGNKRRQSMGAGAAEQARIAEMYKTVIKMSSENVSPLFRASAAATPPPQAGSVPRSAGRPWCATWAEAKTSTELAIGGRFVPVIAICHSALTCPTATRPTHPHRKSTRRTLGAWT